MKVTDNYVLFFSYKDMFSNHYRSPVPFFMPKHEKEKVKFHTGEHFMMYEKATLFGDHETANKILKVWNPNDAKKLGREVRDFDPDVWDSNKKNIVRSCCYCRLIYDTNLRLAALDHREAGKSFVEASPYDKIWGVGLSEDDPRILDSSNWRGQNLLGDCWNESIDLLIKACQPRENSL